MTLEDRYSLKENEDLIAKLESESSYCMNIFKYQCKIVDIEIELEDLLVYCDIDKDINPSLAEISKKHVDNHYSLFNLLEESGKYYYKKIIPVLNKILNQEADNQYVILGASYNIPEADRELFFYELYEVLMEHCNNFTDETRFDVLTESIFHASYLYKDTIFLDKLFGIFTVA